MKTFMGIPIGRYSDDELVEFTRKSLKLGKGTALMSIAMFLFVVLVLIPQLFRLVQMGLDCGTGTDELWKIGIYSGLLLGLIVGCLLTCYFQVAIAAVFVLLGKTFVQRKDVLLVKYYDIARDAEKTKIECEQTSPCDVANRAAPEK